MGENWEGTHEVSTASHNGEPPMIQNGHHIATSPPKAPNICTSSQQKATLPSHQQRQSRCRHHATIENGHRKVFQETTRKHGLFQYRD